MFLNFWSLCFWVVFSSSATWVQVGVVLDTTRFIMLLLVLYFIWSIRLLMALVLRVLRFMVIVVSYCFIVFLWCFWQLPLSWHGSPNRRLRYVCSSLRISQGRCALLRSLGIRRFVVVLGVRHDGGCCVLWGERSSHDQTTDMPPM